MEQDIITRKDYRARIASRIWKRPELMRPAERNAGFYLIQPSADPVTRIGFVSLCSWELGAKMRIEDGHSRVVESCIDRSLPLLAKTNCFGLLPHSPHNLSSFYPSSHSLARQPTIKSYCISLFIVVFQLRLKFLICQYYAVVKIVAFRYKLYPFGK